MKTGISAVLVVHNEEDLIRRCLRSVKGVADEIVVVHDGPCEDRTLAIAREEGCRIFVRPRHGHAEWHRPFAIAKASNDWILMIDADEYLSREAREAIPGLGRNIPAYAFLLPLWDGKRMTTRHGPHRISFFDRSKARFYGICHERIRVKRFERLTLIIHHEPPRPVISTERFHSVAKKRLQIMAKETYLSPKKVPKYRIPEDVIPKDISWRRDHPLLSFFRSFSFNLVLHCKTFRKDISILPWFLVHDMRHTFYQHYYLHKERKRWKRRKDR